MALVRKKDEKGLDTTSVSLIARFSRQYLCIYLHSVEGTKGMEWTSQGNKSVCVCVCVFSSVFLLQLHYCPIHYSVCRSWLWPGTITPSGSYIHDRYRGRESTLYEANLSQC